MSASGIRLAVRLFAPSVFLLIASLWVAKLDGWERLAFERDHARALQRAMILESERESMKAGPPPDFACMECTRVPFTWDVFNCKGCQDSRSITHHTRSAVRSSFSRKGYDTLHLQELHSERIVADIPVFGPVCLSNAWCHRLAVSICTFLAFSDTLVSITPSTVLSVALLIGSLAFGALRFHLHRKFAYIEQFTREHAALDRALQQIDPSFPSDKLE
jgi:hypothetical protein